MSESRRAYVLQAGEDLVSAAEFPGGPARRVFKARSEQTDGRLSVSVVVSQPGFTGPQIHRHLHADEAFFVVEGELMFRVDAKDILVKSGGFVFVPAGTPHGFMNATAEQAICIEMFTPADFEGYFDGLATLRSRGMVTPEAIAELQLEFGMDVVGPPLGMQRDA